MSFGQSGVRCGVGRACYAQASSERERVFLKDAGATTPALALPGGIVIGVPREMDAIERQRILRISVTRCELGRYPSASRVASLAGVHESTVRQVLREAVDRASRLLPIAELAIPPDGEE